MEKSRIIFNSIIRALIGILLFNMFSSSFVNGEWEESEIDNRVLSPGKTDIDYDNGTLHISYYDDSKKELTYAYGVPHSWKYEKITEHHSPIFGFDKRMVVKNNTTYVLFADEEKYYLAIREEGIWKVEYLNDYLGIIAHADFDIYDDEIRIVYAQNGSLGYSVKIGNIWKIEMFNINSNFYAIDIDNNGFSHIAFHNYSDDSLYYRKITNETSTFQKIENKLGGDTRYGYYNRLKVDDQNHLHIVYVAGRDLKYSYYNGNIWQHEIIEYNIDFQGMLSMDLDNNSKPRISYYDDNSENLKYIYLINEKWEYKIFEYDKRSGRSSSLTIDEYNLCHISYTYTDKYSKTRLGYVHEITNPSSPYDLKAESGDMYIDITWKKPLFDGYSKIIRYEIYRKDNGSDIFNIIGNTNDLTYHDVNVVNGYNYTYYIKAINAYGKSTNSNIIFGTPRGVPSSMKIIEDSINIGRKYIKFSFSHPENNGGYNIIKYNVYRSNDKINQHIYTEINPSSFFNDTNIEYGHNYYYFMTAVNQIGESYKSNTIKISNFGISTPIVTFNVIPGDQNVTLIWEPPNIEFKENFLSIKEYKIIRYNDNNIPETELYMPHNISIYSDINIVNARYYRYEIFVINDAGCSEPITRDAYPLKFPLPPNYTYEIINDSLKIRWNVDPNNIESEVMYYRIYKWDDIGRLIDWFIVKINETIFIDKYIEYGKNYSYNISSVNVYWESSMSKSIHIIIFHTPESPSFLQTYSEIGNIILTWDKPNESREAPISGYRIYRGYDRYNYSLLIELNNSEEIYIDKDINQGINYYYYVTSYNPTKESIKSNEVIAVTLEKKPETEYTDIIISIIIIIFTIIILSIILFFIYYKLHVNRKHQKEKNGYQVKTNGLHENQSSSNLHNNNDI